MTNDPQLSEPQEAGDRLVERIARALARWRGNENWWVRRLDEARSIVRVIPEDGQ